jgi:hypothetical protein
MMATTVAGGHSWVEKVAMACSREGGGGDRSVAWGGATTSASACGGDGEACVATNEAEC